MVAVLHQILILNLIGRNKNDKFTEVLNSNTLILDLKTFFIKASNSFVKTKKLWVHRKFGLLHMPIKLTPCRRWKLTP